MNKPTEAVTDEALKGQTDGRPKKRREMKEQMNGREEQEDRRKN